MGGGTRANPPPPPTPGGVYCKGGGEGGTHGCYSATCTPAQFSLLSEVMARYSELGEGGQRGQTGNRPAAPQKTPQKHPKDTPWAPQKHSQ